MKGQSTHQTSLTNQLEKKKNVQVKLGGDVKTTGIMQRQSTDMCRANSMELEGEGERASLWRWKGG